MIWKGIALKHDLRTVSTMSRGNACLVECTMGGNEEYRCMRFYCRGRRRVEIGDQFTNVQRCAYGYMFKVYQQRKVRCISMLGG